MGVDFLRNKRQSHLKAWNMQMLKRSDDLFVAGVQRTRRVIRADLEPDASLQSGKEVLIRYLPSGDVVISQDICLVGRVELPSSDLVQMLYAHDGVLAGRVYESFDELGTVDIEVEA